MNLITHLICIFPFQFIKDIFVFFLSFDDIFMGDSTSEDHEVRAHLNSNARIRRMRRCQWPEERNVHEPLDTRILRAYFCIRRWVGRVKEEAWERSRWDSRSEPEWDRGGC